MSQKPVTEEVHTLRVTCDADLYQIAAEGSVPLQEEVIYLFMLVFNLKMQRTKYK